MQISPRSRSPEVKKVKERECILQCYLHFKNTEIEANQTDFHDLY